jgi:hypothetical protein
LASWTQGKRTGSAPALLPNGCGGRIEAYRASPVTYAEEVLKARWWRAQREIAEALLQHRRVLVKASHSVGKTHVAAGLINWHFDCFQPGITISTAPTQRQVVDVLWKEVRRLRAGRPGLLPKSPRLETSAEHFAVGYTTRGEAAFQGRHAEHVFIVFDECVGIDADLWEEAEGMMTGDDCLWLALCNPTDTSSRAYEEDVLGRFRVLSVSALDHPNIEADLRGERVPYPAAVRLAWLEEQIRRNCTPVGAEDRAAGDVEFPPGSGCIYRPGPIFESRVLGRWPTQAAYSVWSEAAWQACLQAKDAQYDADGQLVIGCDVARYGDDYTSIVVRRGRAALHHETHNGWNTAQTAGRLKELCREYGGRGEDPCRVPVMVDDDGVGGGVVDQRSGYAFYGCGAGTRAIRDQDYPNRRSELWFSTAERAMRGDLDLSRLPQDTLQLLRRQAMAPRWHLDSEGRRVVEPKHETKRRLGRSPDDMDALNLAFSDPRALRPSRMPGWW